MNKKVKHWLNKKSSRTFLPDGVVQSPLFTTPNDPSPSLLNMTMSLELMRHVRVSDWRGGCVLADLFAVTTGLAGALSFFMGRIWNRCQHLVSYEYDLLAGAKFLQVRKCSRKKKHAYLLHQVRWVSNVLSMSNTQVNKCVVVYIYERLFQTNYGRMAYKWLLLNKFSST